MSLIYLKYVLVILTSLHSVVTDTPVIFDTLNINETCILASGKSGQCTPIKNCPTAIEAIHITNNTPVHCGFDGKQPIVCCQLKANLETRLLGEISKQKCKEIYENRVIAPDPLIINGAAAGYDANAKEYPHMAALGYGDWPDVKWACGGTLISDMFIMTAAHCIETPIGRVKHVLLGEVNLWRTRYIPETQIFNVNHIIIHPEFKAPAVYNDIALVELDRPYASGKGKFIAPACLQTETNITDEDWRATGWGEMSYLGPTADHLQVVHLREANYDICRDAFNNTRKRRLLRGIDHSTQMCAGHEKMDTCNGDSGGPLQVKNANYKTGYTVIGITSFGKACALTKSPGVYTRVSYYLEWIESIVWPY